MKVPQDYTDEKMSRTDKVRLNRECSKLDATFEQSLADEVLSLDQWPEYQEATSLGTLADSVRK
jgi:hypothetical protein